MSAQLSRDDIEAANFARRLASKRNFVRDVPDSQLIQDINSFRSGPKVVQPQLLPLMVFLKQYDLTHLANDFIQRQRWDLNALERLVVTEGPPAINRVFSGCLSFDLQLLHTALPQLPDFRVEYLNALPLADGVLHEAQQCKTPIVLQAYKRGINRTERWQLREFRFVCGEFSYIKPDDVTVRGSSFLENAHVELADEDKYTDKGVCIDLFVEQPKQRAYLLSVQSLHDVEVWKRVVDMHRRYWARNYASAANAPSEMFP